MERHLFIRGELELFQVCPSRGPTEMGPQSFFSAEFAQGTSKTSLCLNDGGTLNKKRPSDQTGAYKRRQLKSRPNFWVFFFCNPDPWTSTYFVGLICAPSQQLSSDLSRPSPFHFMPILDVGLSGTLGGGRREGGLITKKFKN